MYSTRKGRFGTLAVGSLVLAGLNVSAADAAGAPSPDSTVVRDGAGWYTQAYEDTPNGQYTEPEQADVTGPQRAPFGTGSHKMTVGQFEVQTELYRTNDYDGVDLGNITRLEYSTFARSTAGGDNRQPTYLRLSVDPDGATGGLHNDKSLYFFPGNNGPVVNGEWQHWDVAGGKLRRSIMLTGDTVFGRDREAQKPFFWLWINRGIIVEFEPEGPPPVPPAQAPCSSTSLTSTARAATTAARSH